MHQGHGCGPLAARKSWTLAAVRRFSRVWNALQGSTISFVPHMGLRACEPHTRHHVFAGIGTLSLGHCHPNLTRAISDQAAKLIQGQQNQYLTNTAQVCHAG
jgi:acetylornithine/succinyldiaminopimelate/putrescine aminotransferase